MGKYNLWCAIPLLIFFLNYDPHAKRSKINGPQKSLLQGLDPRLISAEGDFSLTKQTGSGLNCLEKQKTFETLGRNRKSHALEWGKGKGRRERFCWMLWLSLNPHSAVSELSEAAAPEADT